MSPEGFDAFARRGQLPFDSKARGEKYSLRRAYMTVLALSLARTGATNQEAGWIVRSDFDYLLIHGRALALPDGPPVYFGFARVLGLEFDEQDREVTAAYPHRLAGEWPDIAAQLDELPRGGADHTDYSGLVLANARRVLDLMLIRSEYRQLDINREDVIAALWPAERRP